MSPLDKNILSSNCLFPHLISAYNPRHEMPSHEHLELLADDELLHNIRQGCTDCFALLFHRYCRQVFSVAFRILRHRAETEDILQEVFLSIYLQKERFDPTRGSVRTWILQFAYFKALLRRRYLNIRKFYKEEELSEQREMRTAQSPELLGLSPSEWARYVETGITALGARQREVIELVHFEGYTLQEASEILRESLANTRNYYYRGLRALRVFLESETAQKPPHATAVFERENAYGFES
ncbi:MAG: sigma-70 family RNA polymerase sigma factor [Candidatus Acidiferrales bacterium]